VDKKVYISYVIQSDENHTHCSEVITVRKDGGNWLNFDTATHVVSWLDMKQKQSQNKELVLINFFEI